MYDSNKEITQFHDEEVRLPQDIQDVLRKHRKSNQDRLKKGLEKNDRPVVKDFVKQGSYAMYTINQHPKNDYDIDDGASFDKVDLVGARDAEMTTLDARQMVRDAVDDGTFKENPPKVCSNCVRVFYKAGHHIDIPIYRICTDAYDDSITFLELASSSGWRRSDPRKVTKWFNDAVSEKSPDDKNGQQMRRITRLMKAFSKSRDSWNSPSGFIISVLVENQYSSDLERDDLSLYETMRQIDDRLQYDLTVHHPVLNEYLTKSNDDPCMRDFKDNLEQALNDLQVLFDDDCTQKAAMKAWKKVFNHNFFETILDKGNGGGSSGLAVGGIPASSVEKRGGGRFG